MYKLTPEELETIIRFDETGDECSIWTASKKVAARLAKAGLEVMTEPGGWVVELPKQALRVKVGSRACYIAGRSDKTRTR